MQFIKSTLAITLASCMSLAMAGEVMPYSQAGFDALTTAGKPVVLDISATWCPTCKAQKPLIDSLMRQPAYKDVTLMTIDFDSEKPTLRKFKVSMQSTLVAFKGTQEVGRSVGDTSPQGLEGLVKKTLN